MLRREAQVRAGLVTYYSKMLDTNKKVAVDPVAYANIPWAVAHLALENVYDENDSPTMVSELLKNIVCFNRGLLGYLMFKKNVFTI